MCIIIFGREVKLQLKRQVSAAPVGIGDGGVEGFHEDYVLSHYVSLKDIYGRLEVTVLDSRVTG